MKKALLISGALLALTSSTALAGGVNFAWTECLSGVGSTTNRTFACASNAGTNVAIGSFQLNAPMADFVSVEVVVDLQAQDVALPAWWTFSPAAGNCRGAALTMTFDFSVLAGGCSDPWAGATGSLANYSPSGNRARAIGVAAIDAGFPVALSDGVEYYGVRMPVTNVKSAGAGSCVGCAVPVALVLNSINAVGLSGNEFNGSPIQSNCITWQNATALTCQATPTQNKTWGAIKSIYR